MLRGIRGRLLVTSLAVIVVLGVPATLFLRAELTDTVEERVEAELAGQAAAARVALRSLPAIDARSARRLVDELSRATGTRVDLIGWDHRVIASSSDEGTHGDVLDRPEVRAAVDRGRGFARRAGRAFYAIRFAGPDAMGAVVRVSRPIDELDAAYDRLYTLVALTAAAGIGIALLMTWLASRIMTGTLGELAVRARDLARGGGRRIEVQTRDELGALGGSLNELADGVERSVAALDRERGLLGAVVDSITQGVVTLDGERRITLINDAARRLLGLDGAPVGAALLDHVRVPALVGLLPPADSAIAEVTMPSGVRVVARVAALPADEGCVLMVEDVTAVRRLETIRRDFVANVSHELRTPVSIIRANAETLIGGARDDAAMSTRLIDGLHRNAERLTRILTDLLDLSRLEAGQYQLEPRSLDVRAAADQAIASLERSKPVELAVDVAAGATVRGDPKALDQVLVNLLDNAVKYTPAGGHVWLDARRDGDRIRIEVRDDGPGIPPQHHARVFERFYRVDPGRSRDSGGTGLGLAIAKHLVESMAGAIGVEANHPTGTTFWIDLPAG